MPRNEPYTESELEDLASLRDHPGWILLTNGIKEDIDEIHKTEIYNSKTVEDLYFNKGWLDCAHTIVEAANEARDSLSEDEDVRE